MVEKKLSKRFGWEKNFQISYASPLTNTYSLYGYAKSKQKTTYI